MIESSSILQSDSRFFQQFSKVRIRLEIEIELEFNQSEGEKSISSLVNFALIGQNPIQSQSQSLV